MPAAVHLLMSQIGFTATRVCTTLTSGSHMEENMHTSDVLSTDSSIFLTVFSLNETQSYSVLNETSDSLKETQTLMTSKPHSGGV